MKKSAWAWVGTALAAGTWLYRENTKIEAELIPVALDGLPPEFYGMKLAVVADWHLPQKSAHIDRVLALIALQKPDGILIAGDLTNSYADWDEEGFAAAAARLAAIAPCYAVAGNHEKRLHRLEPYARVLRRAGVAVLYDQWVPLERAGRQIGLYGVLRQKPQPLSPDCPRPIIALAHHPRFFSWYAQAGWDLTICGHAHGGQVRLGKQGLYAPGEGTLPQYTSGLYHRGRAQMVVSRGLGNSSFPLRFGNRFHLPVLVLASRTEKAGE